MPDQRMPPNAPPSELSNQPPLPKQKPAGMATYKRELRKQLRRNAVEPEINFLNITAMMDMMTIILVFLLKNMNTSTQPPQSNDLTMPKTVLTTEPAQEGMVVLISKSHITVEDNVVCNVPSDATHGVDSRYKENGSSNSLMINPLAQAAASFRDIDSKKRAATGKDPNASEAIIVADVNTPSRLLFEVLFTLGQEHFPKYHLMALGGVDKK